MGEYRGSNTKSAEKHTGITPQSVTRRRTQKNLQEGEEEITGRGNCPTETSSILWSKTDEGSQ